MSQSFTDHFAKIGEDYADFRPRYPANLFAWLASQCSSHDTVWDCGAGSGQASTALADVFRQVIATDASAAQLAQATPHPRVEYRLATAEDSGLVSGSIDLVTVAQALHWFDLARFYAEVKRVLKPGGVVAAWSYGVISVEGHEIDRIVQHFYRHTIGPYWPPERHHVETGYRELPFPFEPINILALAMHVEWTLPQLIGYLRSWSATARYQSANGIDPTARLAELLMPVWGHSSHRRKVRWPLSILAGRVDS